jgi:hypothetical protein
LALTRLVIGRCQNTKRIQLPQQVVIGLCLDTSTFNSHTLPFASHDGKSSSSVQWSVKSTKRLQLEPGRGTLFPKKRSIYTKTAAKSQDQVYNFLEDVVDNHANYGVLANRVAELMSIRKHLLQLR